ncbi:hypothetical protein CCACVL1_05344 [Corchorus capsularis]|uniref:Uncharacterized protein n=1 Tax=Corchorus capsularis TaxID=210143 RepID=A0A1R3JLI2_COCAP|nr:hypothetical protein CCACVL1_05344 [Corchorus capsularis]
MPKFPPQTPSIIRFVLCPIITTLLPVFPGAQRVDLDGARLSDPPLPASGFEVRLPDLKFEVKKGVEMQNLLLDLKLVL